MIDAYTKENFIWFPELGMGYYPVKDYSAYDESYFRKYQEYAKTELGAKITQARVAFVNKFWDGSMVDVGVGSGHFLIMRNKTVGYDVNPFAVDWLQSEALFLNPRENSVEAVSFWDSLEHIKDPENILKNVMGWVFISVPIFENAEAVLKSKHFRKDEHCWYWTWAGLVRWMEEHGFEIEGTDTFEMGLGREEIYTFAFKRRK